MAILSGGYELEHTDERYTRATREAYEGMDTLYRHKKSNDHHPEFHSPLSDISIMPVIEMVCDWYGAAYYTQVEKGKVLCKFDKDFSENIECFPFDDYQTVICRGLRDFLVDGSDSIIRSIRDACISYSNKTYRVSDAVLQKESNHIEERFNKEVHCFLSERHSRLSQIIEGRTSGKVEMVSDKT